MSEEVQITKVQKINIQDGDVLAVYVLHPLPIQAQVIVKENFERSFLPRKVKVLILNAEAMELEVLRAV